MKQFNRNLNEKNKLKKIKIGISMRIVNASNYNEKRDALSHEWFSFLEKINLFPICIPNNLLNVSSYVKELSLDGMILSGGDNIGEDLKRDIAENELLNYSIQNNIPIFGVCRGMQVINKFFGGDTSINSNADHVCKNHTVLLNNNFSEFLHSKSISVNSFHNNIIKDVNVGKELIPFAFSEDNTIEGIYHKNYPILGVMWHPERDPNINNQKILKSFFTEKIINDQK